MPGSEGNRPPEPELDRRGVTSDRMVVHFHPRSILTALGVLLGVVVAVEFVFLAEAALTLIAIALFLALALNPAVELFQSHGLGRGWAVGAVYALALVVFSLLGVVFIPPLIEQITNFVQALPSLVDDLTKGHGSLGFLERNYQVVERVRSATSGKDAGQLLGEAGSAFSAIRGVATTLVGVFLIGFLTFFMLLEGPEWKRRFMELVPAKNRSSAERIGAGIYKAVGGFVAGNLLASFLAGVVATIIMVAAGVPYAIPLGLFVAIIELIPYVGPLVTTLLVTAVALTVGTVTALVVFVLLLVYHLIEGHTLRPLVYGRALQLSPLAVLIAILLGAEIAGILGVLAAIPIAGSIQVIIGELLERRGDVDASAAAR